MEDFDTLREELRAAGITAKMHAPAKISAREIREGTGLSQEAFALKYGLELSTLRIWEQERSEPDAAAKTLLWTIAKHPAAVGQSLDMEEADAATPAFGSCAGTKRS